MCVCGGGGGFHPNVSHNYLYIKCVWKKNPFFPVIFTLSEWDDIMKSPHVKTMDLSLPGKKYHVNGFWGLFAYNFIGV